MDQHLFELDLLRAIERLIAVLSGVVAIVLGYRLFMNISQATESSVEADFPGRIKIILTRIGPGVFFALFGASIVWSSYHYQVVNETKKNTVHTPVMGQDSVLRDSVKTVYEETRYSGAGAAILTDPSVAKSRQAEVRRALRALNKWLVGKALSEQAALEPILTTSRLALIQSVWQSNWGAYEEFRGWIKDGASDNNRQPAFDEPYALYQLND